MSINNLDWQNNSDYNDKKYFRKVVSNKFSNLDFSKIKFDSQIITKKLLDIEIIQNSKIFFIYAANNTP